MSLYTGRVQVFDSHTARRYFVPCGGYVASVYLYVDRTRGSHFAPAGVKASEQLKILDMDYYFDQEERDALTDVQVNYFRRLPNNLGIVLWEQATLLDTPSAFQMTSIKRLTGLVLASSQSAARIGLFDPNDSILRDQLDAIIDDIMRSLSGARAFRPGSGRSNRGYQIVCNDKNNTADTIANGDLVIDIVFDATRTTKRIGVRFNINPKGSTATSFVA
jgi:phage tail sheath protein FI